MSEGHEVNCRFIHAAENQGLGLGLEGHIGGQGSAFRGERRLASVA